MFVRASLRIFLQGLATNESQHIATSQLRPSHLQLPAVLLETTYQCTATLIKTVKIDIWVLGVFIDGLLCNFKFRSRKLLLQLAPFDVRSGIWNLSKTPSLSHPFPGLPLKNIFAAMIARSSVPSSSPHAIWSLGCIHANKLPTKRHTLHNYIPEIPRISQFMHRNSGTTSIRCSPSNLGTLGIQQPPRQGWIHQPSSVWLHHSEVVMAPPFKNKRLKKGTVLKNASSRSVWSLLHDLSECIKVLLSSGPTILRIVSLLPLSCIVSSHSCHSFHLAFFGVWKASGNENKSMLSQALGGFFPSKFQDLMNFIVECGYFWITSAPAIVITPKGQIGTSNSSVTSATLEVSDVVVSLNEVTGCPKSHIPRLKRCWISPLEAPPLCLVLLLHPHYFPEDWMKPLNHFLGI